MKRIPVLLILTVGLLAACAQTADPVAGGADPASGAAGGDTAVSSDMVKPVGGDLRIGKPWYLVGGMLAGAPSSEVTLTFEEKTVGGQGPVNSYAADYTATSTGGLTFGVFASTLMAGPDAEDEARVAVVHLGQRLGRLGPQLDRSGQVVVGQRRFEQAADQRRGNRVGDLRRVEAVLGAGESQAQRLGRLRGRVGGEHRQRREQGKYSKQVAQHWMGRCQARGADAQV